MFLYISDIFHSIFSLRHFTMVRYYQWFTELSLVHNTNMTYHNTMWKSTICLLPLTWYVIMTLVSANFVKFMLMTTFLFHIECTSSHFITCYNSFHNVFKHISTIQKVFTDGKVIVYLILVSEIIQHTLKLPDAFLIWSW